MIFEMIILLNFKANPRPRFNFPILFEFSNHVSILIIIFHYFILIIYFLNLGNRIIGYGNTFVVYSEKVLLFIKEKSYK